MNRQLALGACGSLCRAVVGSRVKEYNVLEK